MGSVCGSLKASAFSMKGLTLKLRAGEGDLPLPLQAAHPAGHQVHQQQLLQSKGFSG